MKDLLTGEQMLFTELQNFAAFKSYCILKFGKLVGFLIKKGLLFHLKSNLTEIWNIASIHKRRKIWSIFFKNIFNFWFYSNFTRKNAGKTQKWSFSKIWSCKIGIKLKLDNILQKKCSRFVAFMFLNSWNLTIFWC